jgi:aminomethyltransferase
MGMYTCFPNESGGVIDDLFVFKNSEDDLYLVVNAGTRDKDFQWLKENMKGDVNLEDISDDTSKIDIQGPNAKKILKEVFDSAKIDELNRFYFYMDSFEGVEVMVSMTGYTGELGYELYIQNDKAALLWNKIIQAGKPHGLIPVGLGARDTLRLEAAYSLYGHELTDEISPVEAGLGWLISSSESFPGEKIIREQKSNGSPRKLIALELTGRGVPREGYELKNSKGIIGTLTSGAFAPTLQKGIALALVNDKNIKVGDSVDVVIRNKDVEAVVVKRPFYTFNG